MDVIVTSIPDPLAVTLDNALVEVGVVSSVDNGEVDAGFEAVTAFSVVRESRVAVAVVTEVSKCLVVVANVVSIVVLLLMALVDNSVVFAEDIMDVELLCRVVVPVGVLMCETADEATASAEVVALDSGFARTELQAAVGTRELVISVVDAPIEEVAPTLLEVEARATGVVEPRTAKDDIRTVGVVTLAETLLAAVELVALCRISEEAHKVGRVMLVLVVGVVGLVDSLGVVLVVCEVVGVVSGTSVELAEDDEVDAEADFLLSVEVFSIGEDHTVASAFGEVDVSLVVDIAACAIVAVAVDAEVG